MLRNLRAWLNGLSDRVINEQDSEQDKLNKTLLTKAVEQAGPRVHRDRDAASDRAPDQDGAHR